MTADPGNGPANFAAIKCEERRRNMAGKESKEVSKKESRELTPQEPRRFLSPLDEMERWFEESFRRPFFSPWMPRFRLPELGLMREFSPNVDIFEEGNEVVVKAELPGMGKDEIEVNITDDVITISGEKKHEEKIDKKDYFRLERSHGSFSRSMTLPVETQSEMAKATFRDGVLEIRIPKTEAAVEKVKKIKID
jgi:HSP20 family protein